jgi:glycosyltransferase involved in cell wall biosynthesis
MKKILIIGFVWPEPASSAAGRRMIDLIKFFKAYDYQITFATTAKKTAFTYDLSLLEVTVSKIALNNSSFDDFVKMLNPDIVVFDRYMTEEQFGWRVIKNCPKALRILDTEDLHFLRKAREAAIKKNGDLKNLELVSDLTKREIASIYRCDLTLIISEYEIDLLRNVFSIPEYLLVYFPLITNLTANYQQNKQLSFNKRTHFITIGNFKHSPNKDAVTLLKQKIWPQIKKQLPQAELHIYGAYCNDSIQALSNKKDNFIIRGRAESIAEVMESSKVYLAPLRFGAGIKGKLLDAMEHGLPGVTTSIGSEGMRGALPWNGFVLDDWHNFAEAAVTLYTCEKEWEKAVKNGYEICLKKFNKEQSYARLIKKIQTLLQDLKRHRKQNFTGAMLLHHSLLSTRYLSKYIELKNSGLTNTKA